jgi:plastocyanin
MKNILNLFWVGFIVVGCNSTSPYSPGPSGGLVASGTMAFTVTVPNAPNSYNINGVENPSLTLQRGQAYSFTVNSNGHPFYIMSVQGTNPANAYTSGVTGNGTQSGTVTFVVPSNAPGTLYYDCSNHAAMTGPISVTN